MKQRSDLSERGESIRRASNLTGTQFLFWMGQRLTGDVPLYNMVLAFEIEGSIDEELFGAAVQSVVERSDALKTVIEEIDGVPMRRERVGLGAIHETLDLRAAQDPESEFESWVDQRREECFDLSICLFDSVLVRVGEDRFVWYLNQHHLITDGWSAAVVQAEVADAYQRLRDGDAATADSLAPYESYYDYEREFRGSASFAKARAHWDGVISTLPEPVSFPFRARRDRPRTTRSIRTECAFGATRSARVRELAHGARALTPHLALFNTFATMVFAYLYRISAREHIAIDTPAHNRPTADLKRTIGAMIEVQPLVVRIDEDETFRSLLEKVSKASLDFLRFSGPGLADVSRESQCNVLLNYINAAFSKIDGCPTRPRWIHSGHADVGHELRLQVYDFEATGTFEIHLDCNQATFGAREREVTAESFLAVVDGCVADPDSPLRSIELTSDSRADSDVETNSTELSQESVLDMIQEFASASPDTIAIADGGEEITYSELWKRASRLSAHIRDRNLLAPGGRAAILMRRSTDLIVSIVAVLQRGAAFVPLDTAYPAARLQFQIEDSGSALVLTHRGLSENLGALDIEVLDVDQGATDQHRVPAPADSHPNDGESLAYVIYTSGSTGSPKGVAIPHRALANYVRWARHTYTSEEPSDFPFYSSVAFDLTLTSIFVPLAAGSRIVVYPDGESSDAEVLMRVFAEDAVDIVKLTPAHLGVIRQSRDALYEWSRIRTLIVGGEDLRTELAREILQRSGPAKVIYNEYGPTEATIGCTAHRFDPARDVGPSVPIGTAIDNNEVLLLDRLGRQVPPGMVGEIHVVGTGLAHGYLGLEEATAACFVPCSHRQGRKMYRTGDLAVSAGSDHHVLEYVGRDDRQIKIGGVRIELGEVESALERHDAVRECVALAIPRESAAHTGRSCVRCGLPGTYPDASLDDRDVCSVCLDFDRHRGAASNYFKTMDDLRDGLDAAHRESRGDYDAIVLLSGGKDSSYVLCRVVEMGYRVLAFTLDNGYIADGAKANIRRLTASLGVDHVFGSTPAMAEVFADSLRRYSNVCNGCFKTIYTLSLQLARERGIPCIVTGLSRGQFFETRLADLYRQRVFDPCEIDQAIHAARKVYHAMPDAVTTHVAGDLFEDGEILDEVRFLDFYRYCDVGLDEIYSYLKSRVSWVRPSDTGRSTNCLINDVGIHVHKAERGFHNYAFPYSWDVRVGHKRRDAAMAELDDDIDEPRVQRILAEIGYEVRLPVSASDVQLAAFYVPRPGTSTSESELRELLESVLPGAAVPHWIVEVPHVPLSVNGKIDAIALRGNLANVRRPRGDIVSPRNVVEENLVEIWSEILTLDAVSIHDNFFQIGGDSIGAVQLISQIFGLYEIALPLQDVFEHPTVAELAVAIEASLIDALDHEDHGG